MKRIQPLDGLRTLAVLGVIISHVWGLFGGLPMKIGPVDLSKLLSFGGTGVDLFFVISGFCMYLMFDSKNEGFSRKQYWGFIKKRWFRIAPAFYFVVLVQFLFYYYQNNTLPFKSLLYHILFLNIFNDQNILAPPFWSLATEWHFYIVLPFLFIGDSSKKTLVLRVILLSLLSIVCRVILFYGEEISTKNVVEADAIWYRFPEFGMGIIAAYFYMRGKWVFGVKRPLMQLGGGLFCIALGRLLMTTDFLLRIESVAFIARSFGEPVMCLGYMLILTYALTSNGFFAKFLSSKPVLFLGKISYSMYLWHWLILILVTTPMISLLGLNNLNLYITFIVSLILIIPVSYISYLKLELPYFKKRSHLVQNDSSTATPLIK